MGPVAFFIALSLIKLATPPASTVVPDETIPFETILVDTESGISEESFYVITTRHDWKKLWKRVYSIWPVTPPFPEVDFSSQMIVAAFSGAGGAGVRISIQLITKRDAQLEIDVTRTIMTGPNCPPVDGAIHHPFHMVLLDKVAKPARKHAEFFLETERKDCGTQ